VRQPSEITCDRCGIPWQYIVLKGSNGMIAIEYDLCKPCFETINDMMLNVRNERVRRDSVSGR
jgi:hypothetical protein